MPYQSALTIVAPVRAGAVDDLKSVLATMGDGVANGSVIDFGALSGVHFARLIVVDEARDHAGARLPASLILLSDLDVSAETHLRELVDTSGDGIDLLFGHCEGYPARDPTRRDRLDYLASHVVKEAARYVNTTGRTAQQIRQEAELRDAIADFLDGSDRDPAGGDPAQVRRSVRELVEGDPDLGWARRPADRPGLFARTREKAHAVAIPLLLLLLLPLALLGAPIFALLLRRELAVPRYNDFRRLLHLKPAESFEDLTHNPEWAEQIRRVYDDDIERVDVTVGMFAEPLPPGFAFSDTAFRIFVLMASRRLNSDRFFTADYTPQVYTEAGLDWIEANDMRTVLLRHYPGLRPAMRGLENAFEPWRRPTD